MSRRVPVLPMLAALFGLLVFQVGWAKAAEIELEIFYLPHRPAMEVVKKVEQIATEFAGVTVRKYDFEDPGSRTAIESHHLTEHMPIALFVNGRDGFNIEKRTVLLRNFPKGDSFVPMFEGQWDYADLRAILAVLAGESR